ncbi:hypothetical protein EC973_008442 [Apophysomyces ossiformis]|uniref:Uncharacterized protein n=1 Tax=Apophysomyces ossiformis TaxID=679940 RepID=A0A8H7BNC5_9FUNG|nr:hypothetical protein EC973_008442 [Apophysomyces ossiformis]
MTTLYSQPQRLFARHNKHNAAKTIAAVTKSTTPIATPTKVPGHNVTQIWCSTSTKHRHHTLTTIISCKETIVFIPSTKTTLSSKPTTKTSEATISSSNHRPHKHKHKHKSHKSKKPKISKHSSTKSGKPTHRQTSGKSTTTKTVRPVKATATTKLTTLSTPHSGSRTLPASQTSTSDTNPLVSAYSDANSKASPTSSVQDPNQPPNESSDYSGNSNNNSGTSGSNDNQGGNESSNNNNNSNNDNDGNHGDINNSSASGEGDSNSNDSSGSSNADDAADSQDTPGSLPSPALVGTPASTPNHDDPNNPGNGNDGINETQAVSGSMSNKALGIGLGLGIGCVAAVGLAGLLVHNRRKHQDQQASRFTAGEDPDVNTRWRPQSFMGVVASVVAKLPRSPSLRSNASSGHNNVRASTAGMAIGTGEGAIESPTHSLGRHPSAASNRSAASQPPSLARVDEHQDLHEVDLRY